MLVAGFLFATMGVFVKLGSRHFDPAELALYRSMFSFLSMLAVLAMRGGTFRTRYATGHVMRGVIGTTSLIAYFYAITHLPLATAQTLNYTSPIFLAALIAWISRERPGRRLITTVALGFIGVLVLLRPSFQPQELWGGAMGLASGALSAIAYWNVRELVQADEPEGRVVFYFGVISSLAALVWMAPQSWTPLTLHNAPILAGVGVFGALGQLAMTRAYGKGKALVSAALSYSSIVFSSLIGIVVLGDALSIVSWLGIALIVIAGILAVQLAPPTSKAPPPQITSD